MTGPVIAVNCEAGRVGGARTYVRSLVGTGHDAFRPLFRGSAPGTHGPVEHVDPGPAGVDTPLRLPDRLRWERRTVPRAFRELSAEVLLQPSNISLVPEEVRPRIQILQNVAPLVRPLRSVARGRLRTRLLVLRALTQRALRDAAGVVFLSESAHALLRASGWSGRGVVIRPGMPALPSAEDDRDPVVVVAAHLFRYKRVEEAVAGFLGSPLPCRGFRLDIFGGPYDARYAAGIDALARSARPNGVIQLRGPVPPSEVAAAIGRAAAVVQPSACENAPQIVYECLAAHTPIVASDIPAHRELLRTGLYPLGDTDAIALQLETAVAGDLGDQQRVRLASWNEVADDIVTFCQDRASMAPRARVT